MDWQNFRQWLSYFARIWLVLRRQHGRTKPDSVFLPARLGVRAFEPIESPTSLAGGSVALGNLMRPEWNQFGDVADLAVSGAEFYRGAADTVESSAGAWWTGLVTRPMSAPAADVTAGTSAASATADAPGDGAWSWHPFPTSPETPALGAGPEAVAVSVFGMGEGVGQGTPASPLPNQTGVLGGGSALAMPVGDHGFVPASTSEQTPSAANVSGRGAQPLAVRAPGAFPGPAAPAASRPITRAAAPDITTASTSSGNSPGGSEPSGNPYIVGSSFPPDILPRLYSNALADPANEPELTVDPSQGGDPMSVAFSRAGVRYVDGAIQITAAPDLSSDGFLPFGQPSGFGFDFTWHGGPVDLLLPPGLLPPPAHIPDPPPPDPISTILGLPPAPTMYPLPVVKQFHVASIVPGLFDFTTTTKVQVTGLPTGGNFDTKTRKGVSPQIMAIFNRGNDTVSVSVSPLNFPKATTIDKHGRRKAVGTVTVHFEPRY